MHLHYLSKALTVCLKCEVEFYKPAEIKHSYSNPTSGKISQDNHHSFPHCSHTDGNKRDVKKLFFKAASLVK